MTDSAWAAVGAMAFVIWVATAVITEKMAAAGRQRQAIYDQLGRMAEKLDEVARRVSAVSSKMPTKPSKPVDPRPLSEAIFGKPPKE